MALGVSMSPSRLGSVTGWPWSSRLAMAENVVPRSMPTSLPVPLAMPYPFIGVEFEPRRSHQLPRRDLLRGNCNRAARWTEEGPSVHRAVVLRPNAVCATLPDRVLPRSKQRMPCMYGRSRPPLSAYRAKRIALIKPSALGDIIHSLPVLTALRQRYPHAHIT